MFKKYKNKPLNLVKLDKEKGTIKGSNFLNSSKISIYINIESILL
jgi:hypothetical protein